MKVVTREEFLKLPEGTVFAKYRPHIFGEICIKGESLVNRSPEDSGDWFYQSLTEVVNNPGVVLELGKSYTLDVYCASRDGMFDWDDMFAVWDREEVLSLVGRLAEALRQSTKEQ